MQNPIQGSTQELGVKRFYTNASQKSGHASDSMFFT